MNDSINNEPYQDSFEEDDYNQVPPEDIVAYNELRSCFDLYRLYETEQLNIHPEFQREEVWKKPSKTRFVDSLYKKFPIPSMCFAYDYKNETMMVIDGLQRISTIISLLSPSSKFKLSNLEDIDKALSGKSAAALQKEKKIISKIENVSIPVTILRCDFKKTSHREYIFTIFHRLNTGGVVLNNQEIRNCIFQGSFNDLLFDLYKETEWLDLVGRSSHRGDRFKTQEQILRFFAFNETLNSYNGKLSKFLNDFMASHQNADENTIEKFRNLFSRVISFLGEMKNPPKTIVLREALLFATGMNIETIEIKNVNPDQLLNTIINLDEFSQENLQEGLSSKSKLPTRLRAAAEAVKEYAESCS